MRQLPYEQSDAQMADEIMPSAHLMNNRSMPANAVIPVLNYPDVLAAVDWLCKAFGFRERLRVADHRSQLQLGIGGEGIVVRQGPKPLSSMGSTHAVMIRVSNLTLHHGRTVSAGARIVSPPTTHPYGERQYTVVDPWGHVWVFSETIADADPDAWGGVLLEDSTDTVRDPHGDA